jgi:hypothetical protein
VPKSKKEENYSTADDLVFYDQLPHKTLRMLCEDREKYFSDLSKSILKEYYKHEDKNVKEPVHIDENKHIELIKKVTELSKEVVGAKITDTGKVAIDRDCKTTGEENKEKIHKLALLAEEMGKELSGIELEYTLAAELIMSCDKDNLIPDFITNIGEIKKIFEEAQKIELHKGRYYPEYYFLAAKMCKEFWKDMFGKGYSASFTFGDGGAAKPENNFSKWASIFLHKLFKVSIGTTESLLKNRGKKYKNNLNPKTYLG